MEKEQFEEFFRQKMVSFQLFFRYKTGNNIDASEQGFLKDFSDEHPHGVLVQHGEYTYTAPDGQEIRVQYTADEHGIRLWFSGFEISFICLCNNCRIPCYR